MGISDQEAQTRSECHVTDPYRPREWAETADLSFPQHCTRLVDLALSLPTDLRGDARSVVCAAFQGAAVLPSPDLIPSIVRLFQTDYWGDLRDGSEVLASVASRLARSSDGDGIEAQPFIAGAEQLLLSKSNCLGMEWPSASRVHDCIRRLAPGFSLRLVTWLREYSSSKQDPRTWQWYSYFAVGVAKHLAHTDIATILVWEDPDFDIALASNPLVPTEECWDLLARYRDAPVMLRRIARPEREFVAHFLENQIDDGIRGAARRMGRMDADLRDKVAPVALEQICLSPEDDDAPATQWIVQALGADAALALIETGNDAIASEVARNWEWSEGDGIWEALRDYPRAAARETVINWDDATYQRASAAQKRFLLDVVCPALARDRSTRIREHAHRVSRLLSAVDA